MHETILSLAQNLTGAAETEGSLLGLLTTAAEQEWAERLRTGVSTSDCADAYCCACAFSAAAGLLTARTDRGAFSSFKAGDVSVGGCSPAETASAASALRDAAERLMGAYAVSADFAFRGVRA